MSETSVRIIKRGPVDTAVVVDQRDTLWSGIFP